MNKKLLILVLFVMGVIVYYGLLVVPPRINGKNIVLFVLYMSACIVHVGRHLFDIKKRT